MIRSLSRLGPTGPLPLVRSLRSKRSLSVIATVVATIGFAAAATVGHVGWRPLGVIVPTSIIISVFAEIATAIALMTFRDTAATAARLLLAALFAGMAMHGMALLMCVPLLPGTAALIAVPAGAAMWIAVGGYAQTAIVACVYAALRRMSESRKPFAGQTSVPGMISLAVSVLLIACAVGFARDLPPLRIGESLTAPYALIAVPAIILVALAGALSIYACRVAHVVDRAFALYVVVLAIGLALTAFGGTRYSAAWYLARILWTMSSVYVLEATIVRLFAANTRLRGIETDMLRVERDAKRHAGRTRSLWEIVSRLGDVNRLTAVLESGTRTLRPDSPVVGYVSHLDDGDIVIDAVSGNVAPDGPLHAGARFALDGMMEKILFAGGRTEAWNDLGAFEHERSLCADLGWTSVIGTPVPIGRAAHFLVFGSSDAMREAPFGEDDVAYVDVLAAFVSHEFYETQQRERIQYQIEHDALTGLKNRTQFRTALRSAVAARQQFTLAMLDLDRFRTINEGAGNMIGDELLVEVAVGLASVDERDFVARTSGDGFAMILYGADAAGDAAARLGRYIDIFNRAFHTGDRDGTRTISVAASIGAAHFPADGATADDILRSADVALDAAKARGGAAVVRFDASMTANLRQHLLQTAELADAIGGGQLELVYQPTFALGDTHITGAEALVRWNHPTRGQLPPSEFIAFAERNGLIGRLTRWVIDRAIADVQRMPSLPPGFRCFFNLSSAQLDDVAFMAEFEERLRFVPSIAERLGVEITETAAITNTASSTYALDRFRRLGLRIAIDDFGTGFSSLSYLKRLPVDVIKIDRSFVSGLPSDQKDAALCEMLLQIARRFGLSALAEGIETDAQLRWLRERGCGFGQGYLISKPVAFDAFTALLAPAPEPLVRRLRQPIQLGRSL